MQKSINSIALIVLALMAATLLVGFRFNATWAGGQGYERQGVAVVDGEVYQRGEVVKTGAGQWKRIDLPSATVWMYENTEVLLVDLGEQSEITVVQGRVAVDGVLSMRVREEVTILEGPHSYVHYSWLGEVDVEAIDQNSNFSESEAADFYLWTGLLNDINP